MKKQIKGLVEKIMIIVLFAAIFLGGAVELLAQAASRGSIVGAVTDTTGGVIPGAEVTLMDNATGSTRTAVTNHVGQYNFPSLVPGLYTLVVTMPGFRRAEVNDVRVAVARSTLLDVTLELGELADSVNVTATSATALQTADATVGNTLDTRSLVELPTISRQAVELVFLQPGAQPWTSAFSGGGGVIAGTPGDQNLFLLDGLDVSDLQLGGVGAGNIGAGMPISVESLEEFRLGVTNQNATFGRSMGGQFSMTTRRGSRDYHGSLYWYHQNDNLNANSWTRNRLGQAKPEMKDNRYGFRVGGPLLGSKLRERLFFFLNMEQRRFPRESDVVRIVPSDTLRQGILRFRDATGQINEYDIRTSSLCGQNGNQPCDPRGIGLSPLIAKQYALLPIGNDLSSGDGLNTVGLRGPAKIPLESDNITARVDFEMTDRWQLTGTWVWAQKRNKVAGQLDIRQGIGNFETLSTTKNDPSLYNVGVQGQLSLNLINDLRIGRNRSTIEFDRAMPLPLIPEAGMALDLQLLAAPFDILREARAQRTPSTTWQVVDTLSWIKGKHVITGGINFQFSNFFHTRFDKQGINAFPQATIGAGTNVVLPSSMRPPTCSASVQSTCIMPGDISRYNSLLGVTLGTIESVFQYAARDGEGRAQPIGTPIIQDGGWNNFAFNVTDTWRITNTVTLSLGANFAIETPFSEKEGRRTFLVERETGDIIDVQDFMRKKADAAREGKIHNPEFAYAPVGDYPGVKEMPVQKSFAPRLAVAWNPEGGGGLLGTLMGNNSTVIRAGYGVNYHRVMGVGIVQNPVAANPIIATPMINNAPRNTEGDFFRAGVDGPPPQFDIPATISLPVVPGTPFGHELDLGWDPNYRLGYTHSTNFTIQRAMPSDMVLEIGYIGRYGRRLETPFNLNAVPFFIKDMSGLSNQTFAEAFDAIASEMRSGVAAAQVTPQPFFENNIGHGGTSQVASSNPGDVINGRVRNLWFNTIDPLLPTPVNSRQIRETVLYSGAGWSNYQAFFVQVNRQFSRGFGFNTNYTLSRNLSTLSLVADTRTPCFNNFDLSYCYGPARSDRKHGWNFHGMWEVPLRTGNAGLDGIISGWTISSITTWFSGFPLRVSAGGQSFGGAPRSEDSAPLIRDLRPNEGVHRNVAGSGGVGTTGNPASGGTGLNLFADPEDVYNSFRRFRLSEDTRGVRDVVRGLSQFTSDLSVAKSVHLNETVRVRINADFLNVFNHPVFNNPNLNLDNPAAFGVITSVQSSDFLSERRIQFGLRIDF